MIRLTCSSCQKKLVVDDSKAGKSGKCPSCGSSIRIPEGRAAEAAVPGATMRPTTPPPRPFPPDPASEAIAPAPLHRRRTPEVVARVEKVEEVEAAEQDDEPERPRRRRKKRRKRPAGGDVPVVAIMLGVAGAIYLLLIVLSVFSRAGSFLLLIVGFALLACGHLWFIYLAHQEDAWVSFMVRFVPFYSIYYFFTRIHETYNPFLTGSVGVLFLITGFIAVVARGGFWDDIDRDRLDDRPFVQELRPAEREQLAQDLLRRGDKAEARVWLAGRHGRGALGFEPAQAMQHVQALYARGAKEVFVADIDVSDPNDEHAEYLVVVLPEQNRQALFEYARAALDADDTDIGQKYLVLH
jgi:hypothetical protein